MKNSRASNIDVKVILKEIRDQAFAVLKRDFIGELKALEHF